LVSASTSLAHVAHHCRTMPDYRPTTVTTTMTTMTTLDRSIDRSSDARHALAHHRISPLSVGTTPIY